VNPHAGKGSARRLIEPLRGLIRQAALDHEFALTEGTGHATELARAATGDVVVAVGGDGTLNEIANGILGSGKTLGVLPAGSGNDFIKAVHLPARLTLAFDRLLTGKTVPVDVPAVRCSRTDGGNSTFRHFVNGVGIGFDAAVAARVSEIRYLRGTALYMLAVFQILGRYRAPRFSIDVDERRRTSRLLLIAIGNGPCAGGGFYLTPDASATDGILDVCMIEEIGLGKILRVMPKVLRGGHRGDRAVSFDHGQEIRVSAPEPFYVHADGEIVGRDVNDVTVSLQSGRLPVIVG
jgi:YegS/Rv2252/BmrU family lipid kinase